MEQRTVNRRYRIDRRVGEGHLAIVYLGHDLLLDRPVAVKALRPAFAADRGTRERFGRDAAAAAGFIHPNIVPIVDIGEDQGVPFAVMDYVPAETLHDVIANEGPFGPDDVAGLLEQVAAALDYLHERGAAHRSLSPMNILIEPTGVARLINSGRPRDAMPPGAQTSGGTVDTAHFRSPEEANGLTATPSSDTYALGVIAYAMLTGTLPFRATSPADLASHQIGQTPPPPSHRFGGVPPNVDANVLRAISTDPSRRFPTAGAFAREMLAWSTVGIASDGSEAATAPDHVDNEAASDEPAGRVRGLRRRMSRLVGLSLAVAGGAAVLGFAM